MSVIIKPGEGICDLMFGTSMSYAESTFGKPEDIAILDEIEDNKSTIWHYWSQGFTLFFEQNSGYRLTSVEVDNPEAILWQIPIFTLRELQVIDLFKSRDILKCDVELQKWGEKRVSFEEENIDFYFENGKLMSINFGKISSTTNE